MSIKTLIALYYHISTFKKTLTRTIYNTTNAFKDKNLSAILRSRGRKYAIIFNMNDKNITIVKATNHDLISILAQMDYLKNEFPTRFFVPSTSQELDYVINKDGGFIFLCFVEDKLAGGVIVMYPDQQIHYLSNHDFQKCAIIDSIFLDPSFRGLGLASKLLERALKEIKNRPYVYASVALDNFSSQKLFKRAGFSIYEKKALYNNYERYVLLKESMD
jgi:ribosomal protein S18 acetylase RimI-like enzyme